MPLVTNQEILAAVQSFPNGSAGGVDGLRPQHLKDLLGNLRSDSEKRLCQSLASLINLILRGQVPRDICCTLYGASLTPLKKKDGGLRPIAVGNVLRRLAGKIVSARVMPSMGALLRPVQLGYGSRGGAEAAVHAVRHALSNTNAPDSVLLKLDFRNAFNLIRRDKMLTEVRGAIPAYYNFIHQMYRFPSYLLLRDEILLSKCGVQQGDPLGPLLFCLAIRPMLQKLASPLNVWYLDDGTLVGDVRTVANDLHTILTDGAQFGLALNISKCELFFSGRAVGGDESCLQPLITMAPTIRHADSSSLALLGAPLLGDSVCSALLAKTAQLDIMVERLVILPAHQALFLLKNCFSIPKLLYLLRCAPVWSFEDALNLFDSHVRLALSRISNTNISDDAWEQASLPVACGGVGLRRSSALALPAYLASVHSVRGLISAVSSGFSLDHVVAPAVLRWTSLVGESIPPPDKRQIQRHWDEPIQKISIQNLIAKSDQHDKARLLAVSRPESGGWLHALPVSNLGLLLDDDTLRISIALRLGLPICEQHMCRCGVVVDATGVHGLSCRFSAGRHSRHGAINILLKRALSTSGVQSVLEPPGVAREDGKRPDGMTLVPWSRGKALLWDVTCVDTLAQSHIPLTSTIAGAAAEQAEIRKSAKYQSLTNQFIFVPLAFETFGSWGSEAVKIIARIGKSMALQTGEQRSLEFLRQRISIAIQRGNAASCVGTLPNSRGLDEVFNLLRLPVYVS